MTEQPADYATPNSPGSTDFPAELHSKQGCRNWIIRTFRGERPACCCGVEFDDLRRVRLYHGGRVDCSSCGTWSMYRTGTIVEGSSLTDGQFILMLALLRWGQRPGVTIPENLIAEAIDVHRDTIRRWKHRLAAAGML